MSTAKLPNFIIAGAPKAGTSAIFQYLSEHPEVCGSSIKETRFFIREYSGKRETDIMAYSRYFARCQNSNNKIIMEASPGYLVNGRKIAERIKTLLGDCKLLFILRDPVNRIYSYYHFRITNGALPKELEFEKYLEFCQRYNETGQLVYDGYNFQGTHLLGALRISNYAHYLSQYIDVLGKQNIKILFFEDFKKDNRHFLQHLCKNIGIDPTFYDSYQFDAVNVTNYARYKLLHRFALYINKTLEKYLRHRPKLKKPIKQLYKLLNVQRQQGYSEMSPETRIWLQNYYAESKKHLQELVGHDISIPWKW
jgi:hypothetical protein